MMNTAKKYFYIWSILINLLFACKKESDKETPLITVSSPIENQTFHVDDNVLITGTISDASSLSKASITLLDEKGQPVHRAISIDVSSKEVTLNTTYLLDNIHLESGIYKLCIFASDGKNDAYSYKNIQIISVPRVLKDIFVATISSASQTSISTIDSASGTFIPYASFSGDHLELSVNSYFQELFHCGNATGNFTSMNLVNKKIGVNIPCVPSSSQPYFTGFYATNNQYYVSFFNEQIRGYDHTGNIIYTASALLGYAAKHIYINGQHLIAEEQHKITKDQKLVCYYTTGSAEQNCSLTQDVVTFCERDESHVLVIGNKSGQGLIQEYDRVVNNLWNPYPYALTYGMINCALKLDADTYLFACANGTIYKYVYSATSVTPYLTGYTALHLLLDELSNTLYVVEKNKISTFEYPGLKPIKTVNSTADIVEIGLLYNR